jgi:hypothetical protein
MMPPAAAAAPGTVEARALVTLGFGDDVLPWAQALVDRFMTAETPRCRHLRRRPSAAGLLFADEGMARCLPCWAAHVEQMEDPSTGPFGSAADARVACPACRGQFNVAQATPVCVMAPPWVLYAGLCAPCEARETVERALRHG